MLRKFSLSHYLFYHLFSKTVFGQVLMLDLGITGISANDEMERYDSRFRKEITTLTDAREKAYHMITAISLVLNCS